MPGQRGVTPAHMIRRFEAYARATFHRPAGSVNYERLLTSSNANDRAVAARETLMRAQIGNQPVSKLEELWAHRHSAVECQEIAVALEHWKPTLATIHVADTVAYIEIKEVLPKTQKAQGSGTGLLYTVLTPLGEMLLLGSTSIVWRHP